jgi:ribonuclease HI
MFCHCVLLDAAILFVDSKSAIQTVASNKQATTQTVKETKGTIKLLNRQAFHWVPSHIGIHGNETTDLLAKKGTTLQNKQTPLNFETIKRLMLNDVLIS